MKMTRLQLLSSFLTERLTELVKEVLDVVEDTVTEYREEAARTRRENESLRRQLRDILLLESDTEWLIKGRGSTRPAVGFAAAEQQSSDAELRSGSEDTDSVLNQNQNLQLSADSARCSIEPLVSVQSPSGAVFLQKPTEAWEWAQKSGPQPEVITKSSPPSRHSSLNSPSDKGARHHSDVVLHREEPRLPAVIKTEPEEKNVTEAEGHVDSVTLTPHALIPAFRDKDADRPAAVMRAERHEDHGSSESCQKRAPLTADDPTVAGFTSDLVHRCPRCGEAFGQASSLRLHLQQKRKTYACDWCCKSFAQSADLRRHLRTHTGERPHCCSFCSKSFSQRGNLRRHLRIHTGERPYSCPYCCRSFSDGDTMKKHKRTHSGEKPYRCMQCSKTFTTAGSLQMHVRKDKCFVAKA